MMMKFELLGFEVPKTIRHKNGIEICVPEDLNTDDWCIHVPSHLLGRSTDIKYKEMFKTGLNLYSIPESTVIKMVLEYSTKEEKERYLNYLTEQREQKKALESYKINKRVAERRQCNKPKHKDYDRVVALRKEGYSYREIGEEVGYSYQTVYNIINNK
jgi:hypothetical protein